MVARIAAGPADKSALYNLIQPLILEYGEPVDKRMAGPWLQQWFDHLKDTPSEAIADAVSEYIATKAEYPTFPKVAQIIKLAESKRAEIATIAWRIKKAAEIDAARQPESEEAKAERAAFRDKLKEDGFLRADGKIDMSSIFKPKDPTVFHRTETPQEMAERLRGAQP